MAEPQASESQQTAAVRGVPNEPGSQLEFIRELQPQIAHTLRQTTNAIVSLIIYNELNRLIREDQHFKELKPFRLQLLNSRYIDMLGKGLVELFLYCHWVIEHLQYAPPNQYWTTGSDSGRDEISIILPSHHGPVLSAASLSIASELHILKDIWFPGVIEIGIECNRLLSIMHRTTGREESGSGLGRQVILLAKSMEPDFKLS
ncbi:hypothetical protein VP01_81g10 [Puccinia sorghi]|uniref:Uncharacterized protein n=1 Tax=Puccinia sorghi TaxID=27349 RepID=A0A0L6UAU3_9BASI|nr:hypothetical protein VP01_81g10 [Puccinia sorghi]